jgi:hypothetical protein
MTLTYASNGHRCIDCPSCGQAVRVEPRGNTVRFRCYGGCDESTVAAAVPVSAVLDEQLAATGQTASDARALRVRGADLERVPPIRFLWARHLPFGSFSLILGADGMGKGVNDHRTRAGLPAMSPGSSPRVTRSTSSSRSGASERSTPPREAAPDRQM